MADRSSERAPDGRLISVDVARAVALLSMYVAHFSPGLGPLEFLQVSEYLTAALFATLVGVGAQLGAAHRPAEAAISGVVRGAVLVLLGLVLERAGSQIVVVLVWLGLLTWLSTWVARWRTGAVLAFAVAAFALGPWLLQRTRDLDAQARLEGHRVSAWLLEHLVAGEPYRLTTFACWAALGMLAVRFGLLGADAGPAPRGRRPWAAALVLLTLGLGLYLAQVEGLLTIRAYSGTVLETLLDAALCLGTLALVTVLTPLLPLRVAQALAATGAMTLSLYVVQIYVSAAVVRAAGADDHYWLMLAMAAGSIAFATCWRAASAALGSAGPFARGPLEGVVGVLVAAGRRLAGAAPGAQTGVG